jgi:hypothetical protein
MRRFALIFTLAIFVSLLWGSAAFAHGTGLNNIWTPDVVELGTFQWNLDLAVSDTEFAGGYFQEDGRFLSQEFFATILPDFEIGMAFNAEREIGPFTMYAKYKVFDEFEDDFPVSLAVGCDNIIGTKDRFVSEPIPYIVIGKNFHENANGYIGFAHNASGWEDDNSIFAGFDYMWTEDWMLAVDYYGYNDNEDSVIAGGIYYDWINHVDWNAWVAYDSVTENAIIVFEFAFTGRFDDLEAEV